MSEPPACRGHEPKLTTPPRLSAKSPFIGAILAIIFGRIGVKKAEQGLATNGTIARVGFWLGVISLVLSAIGFAIIIILSILAAIAGGEGTCGIGNNPPCNV